MCKSFLHAVRIEHQKQYDEGNVEDPCFPMQDLLKDVLESTIVKPLEVILVIISHPRSEVMATPTAFCLIFFEIWRRQNFGLWGNMDIFVMSNVERS